MFVHMTNTGGKVEINGLQRVSPVSALERFKGWFACQFKISPLRLNVSAGPSKFGILSEFV